MEILVVNQTEVPTLLPMNECMTAMEVALKSLTRGAATNPLRQILWLPEKVGALGMMPAYSADLGAMGLKVIGVFPGNQGTEYDSHQGAVLLFETEHGRLQALIDATEITAIRTAAVSGVATKLLARVGAKDLAVLGSGVQARTHLEAMLLVRPIERVRVWSRTPDHARSFAERESERHSREIETITSAEADVEGADIICTTTAASEPILQGDWLSSGAHINAVGSSIPSARELDTAAVVRSRLFVDRKESTLNEAGDYLFPKNEGVIDENHIIAEIGELLLDRHPGRESDEEITLFKSLGLAVEDLASAAWIYERAREKGLGKVIELGGERH